MKSIVKICGLSEKSSIDTAVKNGAKFLGFILNYPKSPRNINLDQLKDITHGIETNKVAVMVNPSDEQIDQVSKFCEYLQCHGDETNDRIKDIKTRFNIKIIKAIKIKNASSLQEIPKYSAADEILIDTPAMEKTQTFDFKILKGLNITRYFLAGGITTENLKFAMQYTNKIDVSSGLESAKGIKDNKKIEKFLNLVKSYEN
jgi:phosphoribosylanthranilate isomerase